MEKSTHKVEVIRIHKIEKHPNADTLGIVNVFGGYPCIVRLQDWEVGDLAAYVPPDSLVPIDREEFAFLRERADGKREVNGKVYHRVRSIKLRKEISLGLLIPLRSNEFEEGQDLAEHFGVLHYEPPVQGGEHKAFTKRGLAEKAPFINPPTYDLDALRRYRYVFEDKELVFVTEKIHGANARYVWEDRGFIERIPGGIRVGDFLLTTRGITKVPYWVRFLHVGSRNLWKRWDPKWRVLGDVTDVWWQAILQDPQALAFLQQNPGFTLYGEVYGKVQELKYGLPNNVAFAAFDIMEPNRRFLPCDQFFDVCQFHGVTTVPLIAMMEFDFDKLVALAEGNSLIPTAPPDHIREGIVIKPKHERTHPAIGRVALKLVSLRYLEG